MSNKLLFPLKDNIGNDIFENDYIFLEGNIYIAMYIDKGGYRWVLHPCNKDSNMPNIKYIDLVDFLISDVKIIN